MLFGIRRVAALVGAWLAVATAAFSCGCSGGAGGADAPCPDEGTVTYTDHMRPFFFEVHCIRCHNSALTNEIDRNYANPEVNFDTYEGATGTCSACAFGTDAFVPEAALAQLDLGTMPQDAATTPTEEEIECLQRWVDQDTPQ
jgi:hypothetical protein